MHQLSGIPWTIQPVTQNFSTYKRRIKNHIFQTRRTTLGDRTFPVAAARAWNALPLSVKQANALLTFRRRLKSVLFDVSFAD